MEEKCYSDREGDMKLLKRSGIMKLADNMSKNSRPKSFAFHNE